MPAVAASSHQHSTDDLGETFFERATELVEFLAERHDTHATPMRREKELGEWIAQRRQSRQPAWAAAQHFHADELSVILRALNGPAAGTAATRVDAKDHQEMCWLIARCMAHENPHVKP